MAEDRGADYNTEILPEEKKSETERPKRKWEGEGVHLAVRRRVENVNDLPAYLLTDETRNATKRIDEWAEKACQDLADLLVGCDVGRTIAAIDKLKHIKNVAKDAVLLSKQ
jgi:hypothetical protein